MSQNTAPPAPDRHELWRQLRLLTERCADKFGEIKVHQELADDQLADALEGMIAALRLMNDLAERVAVLEVKAVQAGGP